MSVTKMKLFCQSFKDTFDKWYSHADSPKAYHFAEIDDSIPVVAILSYGKNRGVGNADASDEPTIEAVAEMWKRELDYTHVWRMTVAFASHYSYVFT